MTPGRRRLLLGVLAVGCLPYVALKVSWISGGTVGVRDTELMSSPTYVAANAVTLALDIALAVTVVALSGDRPRRVLVPLAVLGLGLLLPVVIAAPVLGVVELVSSQPDPLADHGLKPWVFAAVYGGFTLQFLALAAATAPHLPARWTGNRKPWRRTLAALATAVYLAGATGWAAGSPVGRAGQAALSRTDRSFYLLLAVLALLALAPAATHSVRSVPLVAATSVWTWSLYLLAIGVAPAGSTQLTPVGALILICGAVAGMAGTSALGEVAVSATRSAPRSSKASRVTR